MEEARVQALQKKTRASFPKDIIGSTSEGPPLGDYVYLGVRTDVPLRKRLQAMWGIRVAYTHSDGRLSKIGTKKYREFAQDAQNNLPGVVLSDDFLDVSKLNINAALHTILEFRRQ